MDQIKDIVNFLAIETNLTTSGQPTEAQLAALAREGCEVIVNLALHDDPRYSLPDETALVASLGMNYIHIPVQFDAPRQSDLEAFFEAMESNQGKKMHVHCAANMRVSAFLGLYFHIRLGRSKDAAFAPLRSIWEPDAVWSAFITDMLSAYAG